MFATHSIGQENIFLHALRRNGWLLGLVALHMSLAFALAAGLGFDFNSFIFKAAGGRIGELSPLFLCALLLWRRIHLQRQGGCAAPVRWMANDVRETLLDTPRMLGGVAALLAISLFCASFSFFKSVIPAIQPFYLDPLFAEIDRVLHFGYDPYVLLMPVIEAPYAVTLINGAYHFWAILLFFMVFVACFTGVNPHARATFLVGFVLVWGVGGNLLAIVMSSAGPVYYEALGYGDTFAPLMAALERSHEVSPVWALGVQELLWSGYNPDGAGYGISAMPSMHVASSTLLALYGFTYARWAGWLLTGFAAIIMLGSVVLAWHYAIDGYLGAIVALCCWRAAAWLTAPRT